MALRWRFSESLSAPTLAAEEVRRYATALIGSLREGEQPLWGIALSKFRYSQALLIHQKRAPRTGMLSRPATGPPA
jgi:hypothetical protein